MEISCNQFEGLCSFYINNDLSDNLKSAFEEHLKKCSVCNMRYSIISSIIEDIKSAYDEIISENNATVQLDKNQEKDHEYDITGFLNTELSAYIDNELDENRSVKIRKDIIAKPLLRKKIDKLYKLRQIMSDSYKEYKNKLRTDYSKEIIKTIDNRITERQVYYHCATFIFIVILAVVLSALIIINII